MKRLFTALLAIFALALIVLLYIGVGKPYSIIIKTLASLSFVALGIYGAKSKGTPKKFAWFMVAAFLFSAFGDVALAVSGKGLPFILGVVGFACAHVMFFIAYCTVSGIKAVDFLVFAAIFAGTLCILFFAGNFNFGGLLPVIICYAAIISFMVAKAVMLRRARKNSERAVRLIIIGSILFILSDVALLYWLFASDVPKIVQSINLVLYYGGQGFLALSLSENAFNEKNSAVTE